MKRTFHLSSIAVLIGGIALSGCAAKKAWSPELIEARQTYERISADPVVAELAAAELAAAHKQLKVAQDAADYFKDRDVIAHESSIAKLKTLEAQQTARALAAKHNLQLARAGETPGYQMEPTLGAAMPAPVDSVTTFDSEGVHYGFAQGGSQQIGAPTGSAHIAQQLASLSAQIIQLQNSVENGAIAVSAQTESVPAEPIEVISLQEPPEASLDQFSSVADYHLSPATPSANNPYRTTADASLATLSAPEPVLGAAMPQEAAASEPTLGAAMPAPAYNSQMLAPQQNDSGLRSELRAMNARPTGRGMALTLGERYFEAQSARLWNGRAARHLDNVAAVMVENPGVVVEIEAHTDNSGTAESRSALSQDRATAIKSALVLRGVGAARINATGLSDSTPIGDNNTELGRLQNRRVEIIFPISM